MSVKRRQAGSMIAYCWNWIYGLFAGAMVVALETAPASALTLQEAVAIAIDSNPLIGEAIQNREAVQFELRQARGLFLPSVDLEGSGGVRRLSNPSRRLDRTDSDLMHPFDISIVANHVLFDGYSRRSEVERQAARVDSASFRVLERSEFIALQITREYFEVLLQGRIIALWRDNLAVHQRFLEDIRAGEAEGTLTASDAQQAEERLRAVRAALTEAEEEMSAARVRFNRLVAMPIGQPQVPPSAAAFLPDTLEAALGQARRNNPLLRVAGADVDAADAAKRGAYSEYYPEIALEGRARVGEDIDGVEGRTEDVQARVVLRWKLYTGGIRPARVQEQIRRASEERMRLHQAYREVEEAVRLSWDRRVFQQELLVTLRSQQTLTEQLVGSYREEFEVGRRSLLDVLDAYSTRHNVRVLVQTAEFAIRFADYRLLAATGRLLASLQLHPPRQSQATSREATSIPPTAPAVTDPRSLPPATPFGLY